MKKYGIEEIKELIDFAHLIYSFKQKKFNFWNLIFGDWKKLKKAIDEGVELWHDKGELLNEIKDLDYEEQLELNRYVRFVFGVNTDVADFTECVIKGSNEFMKAYKIAERWKK